MSIAMFDDAALEVALTESLVMAREEAEDNVVQITTLASPEGQARLQEAIGHYHLLWPHWKRQVGRRNCGLATASCLVSSISSLSAGSHSCGIKEEEILSTVAESGLVPNWADLARDVEVRGLVLSELATLLRGLPAVDTVTAVHSEEYPDLDAMRRECLRSLQDPNIRCIANYHMSTAGQLPFGGHFSTLASYHSPSDSFLILDCWPATEPFWVDAAVLWAATQHHDTDSGRSRGFILVRGVSREDS